MSANTRRARSSRCEVMVDCGCFGADGLPLPCAHAVRRFFVDLRCVAAIDADHTEGRLGDPDTEPGFRVRQDNQK